LDLTLDHSAVYSIIISTIILKESPPRLHNARMDWNNFLLILEEEINLKIPLKTEEELDNAVEYFTKPIQLAAWQCTPQEKKRSEYQYYPQEFQDLIAQKRELRRWWQQTQRPEDKTRLNRASRRLKEALQEQKNTSFKEYLEKLAASEDTDYALWKCVKNLKQSQILIPPVRTENGGWKRTEDEKVETFAKYLVKVFQPFEGQATPDEDDQITAQLESPP
jgi:hypothetical protein